MCGEQRPGSIRGGGRGRPQTAAEQAAQNTDRRAAGGEDRVQLLKLPPLSGLMCLQVAIETETHGKRARSGLLLGCVPACNEWPHVKEKAGLKEWVDCWSCILPLLNFKQKEDSYWPFPDTSQVSVLDKLKD